MTIKLSARSTVLLLAMTCAGLWAPMAAAHEDCEPVAETLKPATTASPPATSAPPVDSPSTTGG